MKRKMTHKIPGVYQHFKGTTYIAMTLAYPGILDRSKEVVMATYSKDIEIYLAFQVDENGVWHYEVVNTTLEDLGLDEFSAMVLYGSVGGDPRLWAREFSEFIGEVDKNKYPDAEQDYRFEFITDQFI